MRLLIVGAGGLVGSNVVTEALDRKWSVDGTYHTNPPTLDVPLSRVDVRDTERFRNLVHRTDPEAVVMCAAMTDVEYCERHPERAHEVNGVASGKMAEVCQDAGVRFVYLSTDYVFDGQETGTYNEFAPVNPLQAYGRSKLAGELAVEQAHDAPLIARLSFVYGVDRSGPTARLAGFPRWVRSKLLTNEQVPLFTDQRVSPSRAGSVAEAVLDLLNACATGTYHVSCRSCVSAYEFGSKIGQQMGASESLLDPSVSTDVDRLARRPRNTCLDVERVETRLGRKQPSLEEDLAALGGWLTETSK